VLSQLPSLSLRLDIEEAPLPKDQKPLAFLQHLGPCLTALHVDTRGNTQLQSTVLGYASRYLPRLEQLTVSGSDWSVAVADREVLLGLAASPVAEQLETLTLTGIELPDMECAFKLLCMPNLWLLRGDLLVSKDAEHVPASLDMPWPEDKPPMELQLERAHARLLAALPLQHFSSISITLLDPGAVKEGSGQQQEQTMQALLAAAHSCPEFVIRGIGVTDWGLEPLPTIGPNCPIQLSSSHSLECKSMIVDAAGIQGIAAAWGPQLEVLIFSDSCLKSRAWAAITPTAFPVLERIEYVSLGDWAGWVLEVGGFCMGWPADRELSVGVTRLDDCYPPERESADQLKEMLAAHGRHNITFTFEWQE
jgi:hypothetical protein